MLSQEKPKILIVDDIPPNITLLEEGLNIDYETITATSGKQALQLAAPPHLPDIILLDINMPEMDGYEVIKCLKDNEQTKDVPVIFITANTDEEDETKGLALGAVDYIAKPFKLSIVKARIKTHLDLKNYHNQLREKDIQLIEMDRIAGINALAAGMAHEINTPLGYIKSSVRSLIIGLNKALDAINQIEGKYDEASFKEYLNKINFEHIVDSKDDKTERINRGIEKIAGIINNLKSFSRLDKAEDGKIDINQSINEAIELLNVQNSKEVEFINDFGDVPLFECSPDEINQCFLHTISNALDACESKGEIRITTLYNETEKRSVIKIKDNGKGMSPAILSKVFNPFFTTKEVGSGTGIGMTITERIIKRHHGKISLDSTEGEGTTVTIELPV